MTPTRSVRWLVAELRAARSQWIELSGFSMAPALLDGDRLRVEPLAPGSLPSVGEIAVAHRAGRLVVHRVVAHRDGHIITRGDACRAEDPPIENAAFLGRIVEVE